MIEYALSETKDKDGRGIGGRDATIFLKPHNWLWISVGSCDIEKKENCVYYANDKNEMFYTTYFSMK